MILSIDVKEAFDKVQHPFLIKTLSKVGIEGAFLNILKAIYETYNQHNAQCTKTFPFKTRNKTSMSAFTTPIQNNTGSPSHINQTRKRNKRHPNWKGGSKTVVVCR